jgi:Family of unknown function (DUF6152)
MQRRSLLALPASALLLPAWAHHGWSSFDQSRPVYLEGKAAKVSWGNPHAEVDLELSPDLRLPGDLTSRQLPTQSAAVDGPGLLKAARLPSRKDKRWEIELAPISRMQAWSVPEIKAGDSLAVLGFTFAEEKGDPVLRAEYLFYKGKAYGLRSSPA